MKTNNLRRCFSCFAFLAGCLLLAASVAFGSAVPPTPSYPEGFHNNNFEQAEGIPTEPGPYGWDYLDPRSAFRFWRLLLNDQPLDGYAVQNQWLDYTPNFVLFGPYAPEVLDGRYSAGLKAGFDLLGNAYSASLAQIGDVPTDTQSLQIKIANGSSAFRIFVGGSEIPMMPTFANSSYTLFMGDVAQFAGRKTELRITVEGGESRIILDDVLFSPEVVPEPGCSVLLLAGLWLCRKAKLPKLHT